MSRMRTIYNGVTGNVIRQDPLPDDPLLDLHEEALAKYKKFADQYAADPRGIMQTMRDDAIWAIGVKLRLIEPPE